MPTQGVYVLTGNNGSGKTSLLVALNRIFDKNAYGSLRIGRMVGMDNFDNTEFKYTDGNQTVAYKRSNRGWEPAPRNVDIKGLFQFSDGCFITTTGFRFYQPDTKTFYKRGRSIVYKDAANEIKHGLNEVFATNKFDNLKYVTIRNKRGRQKTLHRNNILYVISEANNIYSEVHFSLGERLILNTLDFIQGLNNNGLLLIDEIELALHPVAQVRFFELIKRISQAQHLTCIISTHSSTLIKHADRRLYLENNSGMVQVIDDCEPTYILKELAGQEDNRPDYIFFVEDVMALRYMRSVLKYYQRQEDPHIFFQVSYVGGYEQVIRLTEQFYSIAPFSQRQIQAFPDADFQDSLNDLNAKPDKSDADNEKLRLFNRNTGNTTILDITPEKDVWDWVVNDPSFFEARVISQYGNQPYSIPQLVQQVVVEETGRNANNVRRHAKFCFKNLADKLMHHVPGTTESSWSEILIDSYVEKSLSNENKFNYWKHIFKSIVNRH